VCKLWCFDGVFVVKCVANVDGGQRFLEMRKLRHDFELYFWGSVQSGKVKERGPFARID